MIAIEEKLTRLRSIYLDQDDEGEIDTLDDTVRLQIIKSNLGERDEVKAIVEEAVKKVVDINSLLAYDKKLTELERHGLFNQRDSHMFYIERFDSKRAKEILKNIEDYIDTKL